MIHKRSEQIQYKAINEWLQISHRNIQFRAFLYCTWSQMELNRISCHVKIVVNRWFPISAICLAQFRAQTLRKADNLPAIRSVKILSVIGEQRLFYRHRLTLIPAWISNHSKMRDKITNPWPNLNGATIEVWEWMSNFIPRIIMDVITYSVKEATVSKDHLSP